MAAHIHPALAGKFPTPVSHAEDLSNKINEVRSTIKFQLKKVLCLGVAVGHVEMNDDQVLGNVMLSTCNVVLFSWPRFN
jgi:large subunit ribosomal protein L10Ae